MVIPARIAAQIIGARTLPRLLGCGCLLLTALAALPLLLFAVIAGTAMSGLSSGSALPSGIGGLPGGPLTQAGEPLQPGSFRVSQGFGCTVVGLEPAPPPPYTCPPDAAHPAALRFHTGIDLAAAGGTVVNAVAAGTVRVFRSGVGFGLHIVLITGGSPGTAISYLYGHLSGNAVADGAQVRAGEPIGFVGSTGNSSGPHLHFELDIGGSPRNPCSIFPAGYLVPASVSAAGCLATSL